MRRLLALALLALPAIPAAADPCFCDVDPNLVEGRYTALRKGQVNYRLSGSYASYTGDTKGNATVNVLWRGATQSCGDSYSLPEVTISFDGGAEQSCLSFSPNILSDSAYQCGLPETLAEGSHVAKVRCVAYSPAGAPATFQKDIPFQADSFLPALSTAAPSPAGFIVPVGTFSVAGVALDSTSVAEVLLEGLAGPRLSSGAAGSWSFDLTPADMLMISTPATGMRTLVVSASDQVGNGADYSLDRGTFTVATSSSLVMTFYMDGTPPSVSIAAFSASTAGFHLRGVVSDDIALSSFSVALRDAAGRSWDGTAFSLAKATPFFVEYTTAATAEWSMGMPAPEILPGDSFVLEIAATDLVGNSFSQNRPTVYELPGLISAGQSLFSGDCDSSASMSQTSALAAVACQGRVVTFIDRAFTTTYARGDVQTLCAQAAGSVPFTKVRFFSKAKAFTSINWLQGGVCNGRQAPGTYALTLTLTSSLVCLGSDDLVAAVDGQQTDKIIGTVLVPTGVTPVKYPPFNRGVNPADCIAVGKASPCRFEVWRLFVDGPPGMNLSEQNGAPFPISEQVFAGPPISRSCSPGQYQTASGAVFYQNGAFFAEDKDGYERPPVRFNCGDRSTQILRIKGCKFPTPGQTYNKAMALDKALHPDGMANIDSWRNTSSP